MRISGVQMHLYDMKLSMSNRTHNAKVTIMDLSRYFLFVVSVVFQYLYGRTINSAAVTPSPSSTPLVPDAVSSGSANSGVIEPTNYFRPFGESSAAGGSRTRRAEPSCRDRLAGLIEGCVRGYESVLMSNAFTSEGISQLNQSQAGRTVLRHFCREYEQTMQCLHDNMLSCQPNEEHRYQIAFRVGHMRSTMEQTCTSALFDTTTTTSTTTPDRHTRTDKAPATVRRGPARSVPPSPSQYSPIKASELSTAAYSKSQIRTTANSPGTELSSSSSLLLSSEELFRSIVNDGTSSPCSHLTSAGNRTPSTEPEINAPMPNQPCASAALNDDRRRRRPTPLSFNQEQTISASSSAAAVTFRRRWWSSLSSSTATVLSAVVAVVTVSAYCSRCVRLGVGSYSRDRLFGFAIAT